MEQQQSNKIVFVFSRMLPCTAQSVEKLLSASREQHLRGLGFSFTIAHGDVKQNKNFW